MAKRGRKAIYKDGARRTSVCFHQKDWDHIEEEAVKHPKLTPTRLVSLVLEHAVTEMKDGRMLVDVKTDGDYAMRSDTQPDYVLDPELYGKLCKMAESSGKSVDGLVTAILNRVVAQVA